MIINGKRGISVNFTNRDLKNRIVPLFGEQLLVLLVGIADTMIVSHVGEAAVSIGSTVVGRLILSYLLGKVMNLGVIGITIAICCGWMIQALLYIWRLRSGKWKKFELV